MSFVIPHWNKENLKHGHTLYGFAKEFLEKNRNRRLQPTRTEVDTYWALRVMEAFPDSDNVTRISLLEQVCYPFPDRRLAEKSHSNKSWLKEDVPTH